MRYREVSPSHGFAVTAPFSKGAKGTGDADCHSQCAHWLRNDTLLEIRYKPGGRAEASALRRGYKGRGRTGGVEPRPTGGYKGCGRTGGVEPRPYGGLTRSAVNGPSGTPAPTEGLQGVR